jgi:single-strand DNA-binding protein
MNKVILIGRLTRDPELRHTPQGTAVCQITVAVNRRGAQPGQQDADFINVSVWGVQAENVARYMAKGRQVAVEGRIQTRNYDDKDGKRVYVTEVIATNVQFLDSKGSGSDNGVNNTQPSNSFDFNQSPIQDAPTTSVEDDPFAAFGEKINVSDNDLPF